MPRPRPRTTFVSRDHLDHAKLTRVNTHRALAHLIVWKKAASPSAATSRALAARYLRLLASLILAATLLYAAPAEAGRQSLTIPVTEPQPAVLTGDLFTPSGAGPYPTVILLHGCNGVGPNATTWAMWLQSEGYAALVLDSFTARGFKTVCGNGQPAVGPGPRARRVRRSRAPHGPRPGRREAHRGHGLLPRRMDRGGRVAHAGAPSRGNDQGADRLLPWVPQALPDGAAPPLLMLLGGQDDWTPAEPCMKLAESASRAGRSVSAILYPDARHAFDAANLRGRVYVDAARGGKGATIEYNPKAHDDAQKQVRQFLRAQLGP